MNGKRWEKDAEWWLESYAGQLPFSQLCSTFRTVAAKKGWAKRTNRAIELHGQRMGITFKCDVDNLPAAVLAHRLKISKHVVYRWIANGMNSRYINHRHRAVKTSDLINYLLANPVDAWLSDYDGLASLMDIEIAQQIKDNAIPPKPKAKQVKRLDTGQVFTSVTEAAKAIFVNPRAIWKAAKNNRKCDDSYWEYVE